jgi:hypothetical protein
MIKTVAELKGEWADRAAIRDCLFRYSRGIDRCDMALLRTVYWPGAMDHHTGFTGTVEAFIDWAEPRLRAMAHNVHMMGDILIRLGGDKAAVESYLWSVSVVSGDLGGERQVMCSGRYLDRFERRGGEWRIAERMVVHDWFQESGEVGDWRKGPFGMTGLALGTPGRDDRSYSWLGLT